MFKTNCQIQLFRCRGVADGEELYSEGEFFEGFFIGEKHLGEEGIFKDLSSLLLESAAAPVPGDQVELDGVKRTIATVKNCTAADGHITAFRCTFLS